MSARKLDPYTLRWCARELSVGDFLRGYLSSAQLKQDSLQQAAFAFNTAARLLTPKRALESKPRRKRKP